MTSKDTAQILFGTAGLPETTPKMTSLHGMREVMRLKLDTMELEFVKGVKMKEPKARLVGDLASELKIPLSVHAPYYVNLASPDKEKRDASIKRIVDAARIGSLCSADRIVFHSGFYMGRPPEPVFKSILKNIKAIRRILVKENLEKITLRPELTGKPSQFGSHEELFRLCGEAEGVLPCLDFSHLYTRTVGEYNTYDHFCDVLEQMAKVLGSHSLKSVHVHLSGIEYTSKGEKKHCNIKDSKMNYKGVLKALKAFDAQGRVICESPDRGHDSRLFKRYWNRYLRK